MPAHHPKHHVILPSIIEAVQFFGPLTPAEIVEKLALRGEVQSVEEVAKICADESFHAPGGCALVRRASHGRYKV